MMLMDSLGDTWQVAISMLTGTMACAVLSIGFAAFGLSKVANRCSANEHTFNTAAACIALSKHHRKHVLDLDSAVDCCFDHIRHTAGRACACVEARS